MKKPITDEKFFVTDIPNDAKSRIELSYFLGISFDSNCINQYMNLNTLSFDNTINIYLFVHSLSVKKDYHTVITYNDLMANYLPKDTVLNDAVDEALKEVSKNEDKPNKYKKQYKGIEIDVYDVLKAFNVVNPAIQHAIKKLLAGGQIGYKDVKQDYNEAIQSIKRGIELDVQ